MSETFFHNCTPYKHQEEELRKAWNTNSRALLWDCGTGKTLAAITILRAKFAIHKRMLKTLILTPPATISNWKNEIISFSKISEAYIVALRDSSNRVKVLKSVVQENTPRIIIMNYEALLGDCFPLLTVWRPEIIVCDEMHFIKNSSSQRTKKVLFLAKNTIYRYGLTGTAVLNSVLDLFSQFKFIDPAIFGSVKEVFKTTYMVEVNCAWAGKHNYFPKWEPRPEKFAELNSKILSVSSVVEKDKCLDLPPLIKMKREVSLSKEQQKIYNQMRKYLVAFIGEDKTASASIALVKALRLQQIVCGFITDDDGNLTEIPGSNPRLEMVKELLEEISEKHKVILWCCFKHNYQQLSKVCDELKLKHVFLTGEQNAEEKDFAMQTFRNDHACRVLIGNRHAGGIGVNLTEASYSIVFSRNFSLADEIQSEARNYRGGSQIHKNITRIDIFATNTIDEEVMLALSNKEEVAILVLKRVSCDEK